MTDLRQAAEMALEALESVYGKGKRCEAAIEALRQALAERKTLAELLASTPVDETAKDEQEPVGLFGVNDYGNWEENENGHGTPLYTAPPKKEWVGLTDGEARKFYEKYTNREELIYAIDKFLEEKNT